jgi:hypothetical protein
MAVNEVKANRRTVGVRSLVFEPHHNENFIDPLFNRPHRIYFKKVVLPPPGFLKGELSSIVTFAIVTFTLIQASGGCKLLCNLTSDTTNLTALYCRFLK